MIAALALALGAAAPALAAQQAPLVPSVQVQLSDGPREIWAADRGAGADEVLRTLRIAQAALPELERRAGFPLPASTVRIYVRPPEWRSDGAPGIHDGRAIHLAGGLGARSLLHELLHGWFGGSFVRHDDRWIIEGVCELLSVQALGALPELGDPAWEHARALDGLRASAAERPLLTSSPPRRPLRAPVGADGGADGNADAREARAWYSAAYAFLHLLAAEVGDEALRAVHRGLAERGEPVDSAAYLDALAEVEPRIRELAAGWLDAAELDPRFAPEACLDPDGDGLSDAQERALGLDPARSDTDGDGLGDGLEALLLRSDPLRAEAPPAIRVDGATDDWEPELAGSRERFDPILDVENGAPLGYDLKSVELCADRDHLYACFRFAAVPDRAAIAALALDADGDGAFDVVVTAQPDDPVRVRRLYGPDAPGVAAPAPLARAAWGTTTLELSVPRALLGLADPAATRIHASTLVDPGTGSDLVYADTVPFWIAFPAW